jgi:hypothetical protein
MFQRQRMFLKRGMTVGDRRVTGIAGLGCQAEIGDVQTLQLIRQSDATLLRSAGMKRQ